MVEIIPAILPKDLDELRDKLASVSGLAPLVQVDVCDGKFVNHKTWPYVKGGMEEFTNITTEEEGLPFWDSVDFEIDLMIRHPEEVVNEWIKAGAKSVILHIESAPDILKTIEGLREEYGNAKDETFGLEIGVALDINTPNEEVYEILDMIDEAGDSIVDFVQFMGMAPANVGFQGQELDEEVLEKISDLRSVYPNMPISVDGGVNFDNAADLISAGATRLISGSAIFESGDIAKAIDDLANAGE
jgi:ribulose-phosphate 3-epimerase